VKDFLMPVFLLAFAAYLGFGILTMDVPEGTAFPGPAFFPGLIAAGLGLFAVLLTVSALRTRKRAHAEDAGSAAPRSSVDWASFAWIAGGFLGFALLLTTLGWVIGGALLFWCVARGFGELRHGRSLLVGVTTSSLTYIAFDMLLGLSLPSGILGWGF
jgi:putative tricarboxylic transport membrane protein